MTTYTSGLRLINQDTGANATTWGDNVDTCFELLDDAITGIVTVDLTGTASHTLTVNNNAADEARNALIYVKGTPASANSVIVPAVEKIYDVRCVNTSIAGGITIRTNTGTGVNFGTSVTKRIYCDGTSVWNLSETDSLKTTNNLSDLTNVSAALSTLGIQNTGDLYGIVSVRSPIEVSGSALQLNILTLFNIIWPVGSIYSNRTDGTNPGTLMGYGTWASAGTGRVLVGVGTGIDANGVSVFVSAQTCGGEYQHTLTTAELTRHTHGLEYQGASALFCLDNLNTNGRPTGSGVGYSGDVSVQPTGNSTPFNVRDPYYSVYMWIRTA